MTLDEFIKKYTGKGIDYDGWYGFQCMDLYRQYVKEVLEFPQSIPVPGAKDVWNNYPTQYYERIANTPTGVPNKGDIVIWGPRFGPFGHIAVFVSGNVNRFVSFDQNFPTGSLCALREHNYTGVLGWLRPKKVDTDPLKKVIDAVRLACDEQTTSVSKIAKIKYLVSTV